MRGGRSEGGRKLIAYISVVFIWIYSFAFASVPALNIGLSQYVPEGFLTSCSFDYLDTSPKARIFMFTFFVFVWLLPFIIIIFCYVNIARAVAAAKNIPSNKANNKIEVKLAIVIVNITALWFVAWTPYALIAM